MKRFAGAVSSTLRGLFPRAKTATAPVPSSVHREKVRLAMEALAPKGRTLPVQNKAVALEVMHAMNAGDASTKTPQEVYVAANALYQGNGMPKDRPKAVELWKSAADDGHKKAMYSYAGCLRNGEGVARDLATAVEIFERLGNEGLLEAKHALGLVLSSGEGQEVGIPQDEARARDLFVAAAIGGYVPAIHAAASMMEAGKGGEKEEAKAARWLEVAIEAGDPLATSTLATWYEQGRGGLTVNHEKAYELHLTAATRGMPRAQYNTAVHLFEGKGVEQDLAEAARWFKTAADAGVPQAMLNLGKMYEHGLGVPRDRDEALKLYQKGLRAEGQLGGVLAKDGDQTMEHFFRAVERRREKETQNNSEGRVEPGGSQSAAKAS